MDILLLGGPHFLGRALIDAALVTGHQVTMFNRGRTNPELYPEVTRLQGDRDGQLEVMPQVLGVMPPARHRPAPQQAPARHSASLTAMTGTSRC